VTAAILLPAGLPLDATSWEQTPLVVRQVVVGVPVLSTFTVVFRR
jgi:hypothetical protein